jgi:hypothetical protein
MPIQRPKGRQWLAREQAHEIFPKDHWLLAQLRRERRMHFGGVQASHHNNKEFRRRQPKLRVDFDWFEMVGRWGLF